MNFRKFWKEIPQTSIQRARPYFNAVCLCDYSFQRKLENLRIQLNAMGYPKRKTAGFADCRPKRYRHSEDLPRPFQVCGPKCPFWESCSQGDKILLFFPIRKTSISRAYIRTRP